MIEYRTFTKKDIADWNEQQQAFSSPPEIAIENNIPRTGIQRKNAALTRLNYPQNPEPDAICAIVALDETRMVGKLLIVYSYLIVNGKLQRCAVGADFFVLDEYRDRAVGLAIMLKALKLNVPYLEAGVSGPMLKILESWKQFIRVDKSPEFQVALDWTGLVQLSKWDLYRKKTTTGFLSDKINKAALLFRHWNQHRQLAAGLGKTLQALPPSEASERIETRFSVPKFTVQLPWNKILLDKALAGKDPNYAAWLLEDISTGHGRWLLTLYRRERYLGENPDGSEKILREIYLNEIYPPLQAQDPVAALLAFALQQAKAMNASVLRIHAATTAIERECRQFGLCSRTKKSVFIAPVGDIHQSSKTALANPAGWWCRAFSEDQFEESFHIARHDYKSKLLV